MDREQLEAEMEAERERKGEGAGEGLEEYEAAEDGVEEEIEEDKGGNDDVSWIAYVFGVLLTRLVQETFTMDMMLDALHVDKKLIGYDKEAQRWVD